MTFRSPVPILICLIALAVAVATQGLWDAPEIFGIYEAVR